MKKLLFILAAAALALSFTGCSDDDDDKTGGNGGTTPDGKYKITVSNVQNMGNARIDQVRVLLYGTNKSTTVATAEFDNGFTVELPAELDSEFLKPVSQYYTDSFIKVSDPSAKISSDLEFEGYFDGEYVNDFYYEKSISDTPKNYEGYYGIYIYSDSDFTVKGSDDEETYDLTFKKGWNFIVEHAKEIQGEDGEWTNEYTYTNTAPSGMQWVFGGSDDNDDDDEE